jgi:predicted phosphodiesterase
MLLGIFGDLHLTNRAPENRIDNYWETQKWKLCKSLDIFNKKSVDLVIETGDFFDTTTVADRVKSETIQLLLANEFYNQNRICCVYGQHDISGHSKFTLPNSPLAVLQSARVVKILNEKPWKVSRRDIHPEDIVRDPCFLYGASFGEGVPKPENSEAYNILVTHRMIGDKALWPGQVLTGPRSFLRKNPKYNLIICGDYHYRFVETWNGRTIINPGALVRKTRSKFDLEHKPAVVIFDTDTSEVEIIELGAKPIEQVFDLTRPPEKKDNQILVELVEKLRLSGKKLSGWKHFLIKVLEERNSRQEIRDIIDERLDRVRNGVK